MRLGLATRHSLSDERIMPTVFERGMRTARPLVAGATPPPCRDGRATRSFCSQVRPRIRASVVPLSLGIRHLRRRGVDLVSYRSQVDEHWLVEGEVFGKGPAVGRRQIEVLAAELVTRLAFFAWSAVTVES